MLVLISNITQGVDAEYGRFLEKISDIMIASTSHDMRTPLNTIISMHSLIEENQCNETVKRYVSIAKISSQILLFLVDDTLDYYSIKS